MKKKRSPSATRLKGIGIEVRGRFQIRKDVIEAIRSDLGEEYFTEHGKKGKAHRFSLGAVSFREIDKETVMFEEIEISHCVGSYFHFNYYERNGPRLDKKGKPHRFPFDEDVRCILDKVCGTAKRDLELTYDLPPARRKSASLHNLKVGGLRLGGIKVLLGDDPEDADSAILDWQERAMRICVRLRRRIPISTTWPTSLLKYLNDAVEALKKGGLDL